MKSAQEQYEYANHAQNDIKSVEELYNNKSTKIRKKKYSGPYYNELIILR